MTTRSWFRVHSFTGVITGLMLFVVCWTGTFAVLSYEIDWLVTPGLRVSPAAGEVSWGAGQAAIEDAVPGAEVWYMIAGPYARSAVEATVGLPDGGSATVFFDPGTGEVTGAGSGFGTGEFFRRLHSNLFGLGLGALVLSRRN